MNKRESMVALDTWLDKVQAIFVNRYFAAAMLAFWFLLYNYVAAVLPSLPYKSVIALVTCAVIGGASTYTLSRSTEVAALEETAIKKLRKLLAAYLEGLRDEAARGASGAVVALCTAVSALVQTLGLLVVLGCFEVVDFIRHAIVSGVLTVADGIQFFCTLLGLGADVVTETLQPLTNAITKVYIGAEMAASIVIEWSGSAKRNATKLFLLALLMDLLLPFNALGQARAAVQANYAVAAGAFIVLVAMTVASWAVPRTTTPGD